jgi:ATP-binding cassette subfamily F protein uup
MPVIDCRDLLKSYGDHAILAGVSLTIRRGERVGLVGDSGCGKSTLGRILAGVEAHDGGEISRRRGTRVDVLEQEPNFEASLSVRDIVLGSLVEWSTAKQQYDELTSALSNAGSGEIDDLIQRQSTFGEEVERLGGWERMHEAEAIVHNLGIKDPERLIETLSGGERRRVALARLLIGEPDLAILDEPTNHLDIATIEWLEDHLCERFRGALLIITHDRYVLDNVASRTLELHEGKLDSYDGGYIKYLEGKSDRQAHAQRVERNRQNFLRREIEWLRRGPKARGTKPKARIGRALDALAEEGPTRVRTADLRAESTRQGKTILHLENLGLERDGRVLIRGLDLDLASGERIGIVGPNGIGKTSLLLCVQGKLEPREGSYQLGTTTKIGYLDQARAGLDDEETLRDAAVGNREYIELGGERMRVGSYLERFLFDGADQRKKVGVLSGGERSRVCLAKLLCETNNLLLLDEPTNDLDVSTLGALEAMLLEYPGSALIVSHDRWFLDRVATSILAFEDDGKVDLHRGGYSDYREKRDREEKKITAQRRAATAIARRNPKRDKKSDSKTIKKLTFKENRELDGLFERIEAAEAEAEGITAQLSDPTTYRGGDVDVAGLSEQLEQARRHAAELLARWEELEARRDANPNQ